MTLQRIAKKKVIRISRTSETVASGILRSCVKDVKMPHSMLSEPENHLSSIILQL
jgi:hypothetical protein